MGYEFDANGMFVGWSPFFNFESIQSLKKSEEIPTPNGNTYKYADQGLDITQYLQQLNKENIRSAQALPMVISMLQSIDNYNGLELTYDTSVVNEDNANFVLNKINEHNMYMTLKYDKKGRVIRTKGQKKIPQKNILLAFKNSASSKISRVIQDPKNANAAYTPINMDDPKAAAANSELGKESDKLTATSPSSKWIMTVQNMSGRQVIGITAVGEKIFFAASYYFNECVNSNDSGWFNKAFFQNVIDKVQSRPVLDKNGNPKLDKDGNPVKMTVSTMRNIIANVNFNWNPAQREVWKNLMKKVMVSEGMKLEDIDAILQEQLGLQADQSLVISALLSAATDNAKELILDKINAGPTLAGMYLHLIMLNYSFEDIAKFMTSETVQTIATLAKQVNLFDDYHDTDSGIIDQICNSLERGPIIDKYLSNDSITYVMYALKQAGQIEKFDRKELQKYLQDKFDSGTFLTKESFPARNVHENRFIQEFNRLLVYKKRLDQGTFETFRKIKEEAKETTMLGRGFGINQGIATDIAGKLSFLNALEQVITNAEEKYPVSDQEKFVEAVIASKPYLEPGYVSQTWERANSMDIIGNFEIEKFLDPNNTDYREAAIEYQNCLKTVWPFFDMIDKIPHYKALYKVLYWTELTDSHISNKYRLIKQFKKQLIEEKGYGKYFDNDKLKALANAVDEVLITNWLQHEGITFELEPGQKYFTPSRVKKTISEEDGKQEFNLATDEGRATFKLWMESHVIPELRRGNLVDRKQSRKVRTNQFLKNLKLVNRIDRFTTDQVDFLALPIDMLNIKTESDQANFDRYAKGFSQLKDVTLQGRSVADWLFLYNLIVNGNQFGSDRLTTIFGEVLRNDEDSIILKYETEVGDADYNEDTSLDNFSLDDLLIKLAPVIPRTQIYRAKDQFIRVWNPDTERYQLMAKAVRDKSSMAFDDEFASEVADIEDTQSTNYGDYILAEPTESLEATRDYYNYYILRSPKQSEIVQSLKLTDDSDSDDVLKKIKHLMKRNTITVEINCE